VICAFGAHGQERTLALQKNTEKTLHIWQASIDRVVGSKQG
jgi:hypothetical protein